MAKFNVGDKVRPIPYGELVESGKIMPGEEVNCIGRYYYDEMCDGNGHFVETARDKSGVSTYKIRFVDDRGIPDGWWLPEWAIEPAEPKLEVPKAQLFAPPESVNILGTEYRVEVVEKFDDDEGNLASGFTDPDLHVIKLRDLAKIDEWSGESAEKVEAREKEIFRHEIVHAYLNESGLKFNCGVTGESWARNEEMVDWIAIQGPKIMETWKEAGCLR